MENYRFWADLAGHEGQYNDLQFEVLRANGYTGSNPDMYAAWRKAGKPTLTAIEV